MNALSNFTRQKPLAQITGLSLVTLLAVFSHVSHSSADVRDTLRHRNQPAKLLWELPVAAPATMTSPFRSPPHPYAAGHRGIDFKTAMGDEVTAPATGTVHFVGVVAHKPVITVRVDEGTLYSFEPVASELHQGDLVVTGQPLGVTNVGGHCEASCVHFGVRVHGEYVNPLHFLTPRPSLLPVTQLEPR